MWANIAKGDWPEREADELSPQSSAVWDGEQGLGGVMPRKAKRSLSAVVGKETCTVWVNMLRELAPDGRTHRLSVVVASMLQYALTVAQSKRDEELADDSVERSLLDAAEVGDPSEVAGLLHDVTTQLFKDAGVEYQRTNSRGSHYSIVEDAYEEFMRWCDMPWE